MLHSRRARETAAEALRRWNLEQINRLNHNIRRLCSEGVFDRRLLLRS